MPGRVAAEIGSQRSQMPSTRISAMEDTNSGTPVRDRLPTLLTPSGQRPARIAAYTPAPMDSGTTMTKATAASFRELSKALPTNGATGLRKV